MPQARPNKTPSKKLDSLCIRRFRRLVLDHYKKSGRSFPWRETRDPWAILVSEIMLQQTQTDRVLPKYRAWMERFPGPGELAAASLGEVLALWSGLGYNRRALALFKTAKIVRESGGRLPDSEEALRALPGIGCYTARALLAFAFDRPVVLIETNVRTVFLHHFFQGEQGVSDARILELVAQTLHKKDPRNWYYALMDYGVSIKKTFGNPNAQSLSYAKQSPFADSQRRIRGELLRELGKAAAADAAMVSRESLASCLPFARERVEKALADLAAEGFVEYVADGVRIKG